VLFPDRRLQAGASFTGSCHESFAEDEPQSFKLATRYKRWDYSMRVGSTCFEKRYHYFLSGVGHASDIWKVGCRQNLYFVSLAFAMVGALSWQVGIY